MESIGAMVSAEHIAKVIGKGGAGLRQIRETTGVKIQVQQNDGSGAPRRVDLSGGSAQVAAAFQMLAAKAFPDSDAHIYIPAAAAGQVVGRGGENLRRVRELCNVRLSLVREPEANPATGQQERLLTMSGEPGQLGTALRCVLGDRGGPSGFMGPGMGPMSGMPGQGGILSQVRAASADPDEVQIHVAVPDGLAGAIIGKAGEQIKQTAATAGCRVSMSSRESGGTRHAVCQGSFSQCMTAQQMLHDQISAAAEAAGQAQTDLIVLFMVRKEAAGAVIGKSGASLNEVRDKSGARIQLAREEAAGQRPCCISGTLEAVTGAESLIHEIVKSAAPPPGAVPAPGQMPGMVA